MAGVTKEKVNHIVTISNHLSTDHLISFNSTDVPLVVADACMSWTQELFSCLAAHTPVILLEFREFIGAWQKGWHPTDLKIRKLAPNLYRKRYLLPTGWFSRYPSVAMKTLGWMVERGLRKLGIKRYRLVLSFPQYLRLLSHLQPDSLIYYWSDDFRAYWPNRVEETDRFEKELVERADLVVCASRSKADEIKSQCPETTSQINYLVHGIGQESIVEKPLYAPACMPLEGRDLPRPVLGYYGSLGNVDLALLERLAKTFPNATLLIIGFIAPQFAGEHKIALERLFKLTNVKFLGPKPRSEAIHFMRSFDICLLPYQLNRMVSVSNPSKLRDYFATSRPVVSTGFPDAELFRDCIEVGHTHEEFIEAVASLIERNCQDGRYERRLEQAGLHTWEMVAKRLWLMIESASAAGLKV